MTSPAGAPRGGISSRQHLLNFVVSSIVGIAVFALAGDLIWAVVAFLLTGILAHTVLLAFRLRVK